MAEPIALSQIALDLLRLHRSGGSLMVGVWNPESLPDRSVEKTRAGYQELVDAGLMIALHSFANGRDARYRLTEAGFEFDGLG